MTQPARRFDLWRRLYTRFLIEPFPAGDAVPAVSTLIVPVTQADELLSEPRGFEETTEASAALAANLSIATVPAGNRWRLQTINVLRTSGDNTFSRFLIQDASRGGLSIAIDTFASVTGATLRLDTIIRMDEGDAVRILMDGAGVAASNMRVQLWLEEEAAF